MGNNQEYLPTTSSVDLWSRKLGVSGIPLHQEQKNSAAKTLGGSTHARGGVLVAGDQPDHVVYFGLGANLSRDTRISRDGIVIRATNHGS